MADSLKRRPRREWDDDDGDENDRPARRKETNRGGGATGTGVMLLVGLVTVLFGGIAAVGAVGYYLFAARAPAPPAPVAANRPMVMVDNGRGKLEMQPLPFDNRPVVPLPGFDPAVGGRRGFQPAVPFAPAPALGPRFAPNPNGLIDRHRAKLVVAAGPSWAQWGPEKAVDGNESTSWFPHRVPAPDLPWLTVRFPEPVTVRRVTVLGNREPMFAGYQVPMLRIELFDAAGTVLGSTDCGGAGTAVIDADAVQPAPVPNVTTVRITLRQTDPAGGAVAEVQVD